MLHFVFKIMRRILNVQKLLEVNLAKNENVIDYEKGELLMCVDETAVDEIISFNNKYANPTSVQSLNEYIISIFEEKKNSWMKCLGLIKNGLDLDDILGNILVAYSASISESYLTVERVLHLKKLVEEYERDAKHKIKQKFKLYYNLGNLFGQLGRKYDTQAVWAFKKSFFYQLSDLNHASYQYLNCFSFRKISDYFIENLKEETLGLSCPLKFNDVFDCPIIELLDNDDGPSRLKRQALIDCVKITCFEKNTPLPTIETAVDGSFIRKSDAEEFANELLWSHYADNHQGVCVEYLLDSSLTRSAANNDKIISFFSDVIYLDNIDLIKHDKSINLHEGFFAKSKAWSYENELRYLYFDIDGSGDYASIKIPNMIKSIMFGIRCAEDKKREIISIMRDRKYRTIRDDGTIVEENVKFYQMEKKSTILGHLDKKEITLENI